jgi:hypothetical protein
MPPRSATFYANAAEIAAELALRIDVEGLLGLLGVAAEPAAAGGTRLAQLRVLADGVGWLIELGAFDDAARLADRVALLAAGDDAAAPFAHECRALVAAGCGAYAEARDDALAAARGHAARGDEPRALAARLTAAAISTELGDLLYAAAELEPLLARRDLPPSLEARARLVAGKLRFLRLALGEARLMLRRVAAAEPWIHGRALIYLARAALRAGHASLAENEARAAIAVLPDLPALAVAAHATLAQALVRQQRHAEALVAARAAFAAPSAPDLARILVIAQAQLAAELGARLPFARTA